METAATLKIPEFGLTLILGWQAGFGMDYELYVNNESKPLFKGNDYRPSPLYGMESLESAVNLLAFLTAQPGDADPDFFKGYTKKQMRWAESNDCECIKAFVNDLEDQQSEYHHETLKKVVFSN